jgi:hypothetical protein
MSRWWMTGNVLTATNEQVFPQKKVSKVCHLYHVGFFQAEGILRSHDHWSSYRYSCRVCNMRSSVGWKLGDLGLLDKRMAHRIRLVESTARD